MRYLFILSALLIVSFPFQAQQAKAVAEETDTTDQKKLKKPKVIFGIASYYADKFNGRPTANGEIYDGKKNDCSL